MLLKKTKSKGIRNEDRERFLDGVVRIGKVEEMTFKQTSVK